MEVTEYIEAFCPALANSVHLDAYITDALESLDPDFWEDKYNKAVYLLASHNYCVNVSRKDGVAGLITSMTENRVSVRIWNSLRDTTNAELHTTIYGKRLISLRKSLGKSITIANPNARL